MIACRRVALAMVLACALVGCSTWESEEHGVAYTFSNHCDEELTVQAVRTGDVVVLPVGETRTLQTVDQDPNLAFVVSGAAGTEAVQIIPGTSTFAIDDDRCPTDA